MHKSRRFLFVNMSNPVKISLQLIKLFTVFNYFNLIFAQNINTNEIFTIPSTIDIKFASNCIWNVTRETSKGKQLITIFNGNITKEPGYSIISTVTKMLQKMTDHYTVYYEITNGTEHQFPSFEKCIETCNSKNKTERICKRYFITTRRTQMYLIFIDNLQDFNNSMKRIEYLRGYNISAEFLLIYTNLPHNTTDLAQDILDITYENSKFTTRLLIPASKDVFELYTLDLFAKESKYCATQPVLTLLNTCTQGNFNLKMYHVERGFSRLNCTIQAIAMHFPPFVISPEDGVEILILNEIENRYNVTFEKAYHSIAGSWGFKKKDGSWSGLLTKLYKQRFKIGLGAVSYSADRRLDFHYSDNFFSEKMFWVVPSAHRLERWKLLLIIFKWTTWIVLLVFLLLIAVLLWFSSIVQSSLNKSADRRYTKFGFTILTIFQLFIYLSTARQPNMLPNRILYISYSIFMMIVGACYQSAMINVLTNPQCAHQISSYGEVVQSNLIVGGVRNFKSIFDNPHIPRASVIYNKYTYYTDDEGMEYWTNRVAKGEAITIQGEFFTKYYKLVPELTNHDGSSKIYIITNDDDVVLVDTYRFIYSKNFFLRAQINTVIKQLVNAGFINFWAKYYIYRYQGHWAGHAHDHVHGNSHDHDHKHDVVLTLNHLEGAFGLWFIGNIFGVCALVFEWLIGKVAKIPN